MNNIDLIETSLQKLKSQNISNPELDLRVLLNNCSKLKKEVFLSNFNSEDIFLDKFNFYLERRLKHEPISKIINKKNFWKYDFFVNSDVLDPRPETELIIEEALFLYKNKKRKIKILDIGTGTGCLSICLAKELINSKVTSIDISNKAISVAKKNIKDHFCQKQINLEKTDISNINHKYDLIVSNPPYLSIDEYLKTADEIKKYEPKLAFAAGSDGLNFYRVFANKLPEIMKKNSNLILEIGENQFSSCIDIFGNSGLAFLKKRTDLQKKDRIVVFTKI